MVTPVDAPGGATGWHGEIRQAGAADIVVRDRDRRRGIGRALMDAFEGWAAAEGCALVALATRRAAPFYRDLGYEESASYFRKLLVGQEPS
jgi:GNAT superfamily N-acetyltransferase